MSLLHDIDTFVIIRCRQTNILSKAARFGVTNIQGMQNTGKATERCYPELAVSQKISSEV